MNLRIFLSADLAGSTAFKQNNSAHEWQKFFSEFYSQLPAYVDREFGPKDKRLSLWKTIGDEIVFSAELGKASEAVKMVAAFRKGVAAYRLEIVEPPGGVEFKKGLDLKCAGWTAGFPVGNLEVELPATGGQFDYIGPGMDIGFRLVKEASPRRMLLAVELAFILSLPRFKNPKIIVGTSLMLKGVKNGRRYPCLWVDCFPGNCTTWDKIELQEELLRSAKRTHSKPSKLHKFCRDWLESMGEPFLVPFIPGDPMIGNPPAGFQTLLERVITRTQGAETIVPDDPEPGNQVALDPAFLDGPILAKTHPGKLSASEKVRKTSNSPVRKPKKS